MQQWSLNKMLINWLIDWEDYISDIFATEQTEYYVHIQD